MAYGFEPKLTSIELQLLEKSKQNRTLELAKFEGQINNRDWCLCGNCVEMSSDCLSVKFLLFLFF